MGENRRYYWLKLQENFFDDDTIDFIESQENGEKYVLFYLKLCLKALKNQGKLIRYVGEFLMPYDELGISKLTKTDVDVVRSALPLFAQIGLIKRLETGEIYLTQLNEIVGTETNKAKYMRQKRLEQNRTIPKLPEQKPEEESEIKSKITKHFEKPSVQEIADYCKERKNGINANNFFDFYESKNWMIGKNKMKDWKACVRTWERNSISRGRKEVVNEQFRTEEIIF